MNLKTIFRLVVTITIDWLLNVSFTKKRHLNRYGLTVVRVDSIGDFILWLDYARSLNEYYKGQKKLLITNHLLEEYAKSLGYWDDVIGINLRLFETNLLYRMKAIKKVRSVESTFVINPVYSRELFCGDSLVRALQSANKIGSRGDFANSNQLQQKISDRWYTKIINVSESFMHEIARNAEFLENVCSEKQRVSLSNLPIMHVKSDLVVDEAYCVIFPGASWAGRQWPIESFAKIANFIYKQYGIVTVLCGSAGEWDLCEKLKSNFSENQGYNFAGLSSIQDLVEIIRRSKLLVSNETSAVHIAATNSVKTICIAGGGHWGRFIPYPATIDLNKRPIIASHKMNCYNCDWNCIYSNVSSSPVPCVENISVQQVKGMIEQMMPTVKR